MPAMFWSEIALVGGTGLGNSKCCARSILGSRATLGGWGPEAPPSPTVNLPPFIAFDQSHDILVLWSVVVGPTFLRSIMYCLRSNCVRGNWTMDSYYTSVIPAVSTNPWRPHALYLTKTLLPVININVIHTWSQSSWLHHACARMIYSPPYLPP